MNGLPRLLSNAETYAQLAVLATLGAEAVRASCTCSAREPGRVLLTVGGSARPGVVEGRDRHPAVLPSWTPARPPPDDGVLVGGYHGAWLHADARRRATVSRQGIAERGRQLGAGMHRAAAAGEPDAGETVPGRERTWPPSRPGSVRTLPSRLPDVAQSMWRAR
ncbi:hypothetical protein [Streptosporangium vulgare]|uniref:hypothetical protein n=1 Tax=Streptosporangium vulgare TaxID=46190 RepID=UPI0031D99EC9